MILSIVWLVSLFEIVQSSCHIFEQGTYGEFDVLINPSFVCYNGASFQGSIQFQENFLQIPQIVITTVSYHYDKEAQYRFKILTQTTNQWTFSLECPSLGAKVQKYEFSWIAVLDDRLFVINDYMASNLLVTGFMADYYSTDSDLNVVVQEVSYFGGEIDLQIFASGNRIRIKVIKGTSGLGVQIIACSCLTMYQGYTSRSFIDTNTVIVYSNTIPIYNIYSMFDMYSTTFRQLQFFETNINGMKELSVSGQGGGYYQFYVLEYHKLSLQPHYYKKIRVSKKRNADYNNYIQFNFQQLNLTQHKSTYQDEMSAQFNNFKGAQLIFIYQYRCQPGYKIIGNVLTITNTYYNFIQFCNKSFDLLTIYIYLFQDSESNRNLFFELNKKGVKIQQMIDPIPFGCQVNTFTLVTLEITKQ